jgi:hypothetical protein
MSILLALLPLQRNTVRCHTFRPWSSHPHVGLHAQENKLFLFIPPDVQNVCDKLSLYVLGWISGLHVAALLLTIHAHNIIFHTIISIPRSHLLHLSPPIKLTKIHTVYMYSVWKDSTLCIQYSIWIQYFLFYKTQAWVSA